MKLIDIINHYKNKLDNEECSDDEKYAILLFALQLPSMCSRYDFPINQYPELYYQNGNPKDKELYLKWIKSKASRFEFLIRYTTTIEDLSNAFYHLRCLLTHEGFLITNEKISRFIFTQSSNIVHGTYWFINISDFCHHLFSAAETSELCCQDITIGYGFEIPKVIQKQIDEKTKELIDRCWNDKPEEYYYFLAIRNYLKKENLLDDVKNFFERNPNEEYQIENFETKECLFPIKDNRNFTILNKRKYSEVLCHFNKEDFRNIMSFCKELDDLIDPINEIVEKELSQAINNREHINNL